MPFPIIEILLIGYGVPVVSDAVDLLGVGVPYRDRQKPHGAKPLGPPPEVPMNPVLPRRS